jgi:LPXTG-site transpeptidase (sortase) family protein
MSMSTPSRLTRVALATTGLTLALASLVTFLTLRTPDVGDIEAIEQSLVSSTTTVPAPPTSVVTSDRRPGAIAPNAVNRLEQVTLADRLPTRLEIPALGVDAPIEPYGVNRRSGQMDVPRNVTDVAWYKHGPAPGESGSAVLAAHVDLSDQGRGVFFGLRRLELGDTVTVSFSDGGAQEFQVIGRATYHKSDLPLESIFSSEGSPVLTLVTCGGAFSGGNYDSNVVVYAVPVSPPGPTDPA